MSVVETYVFESHGIPTCASCMSCPPADRRGSVYTWRGLPRFRRGAGTAPTGSGCSGRFQAHSVNSGPSPQLAESYRLLRVRRLASELEEASGVSQRDPDDDGEQAQHADPTEETERDFKKRLHL